MISFARCSASSTSARGVFCVFFTNARTTTTLRPIAVTYNARAIPSRPVSRSSYSFPSRCLTCGSLRLSRPTEAIRSASRRKRACMSAGRAVISAATVSLRISNRQGTARKYLNFEILATDKRRRFARSDGCYERYRIRSKRHGEVIVLIFIGRGAPSFSKQAAAESRCWSASVPSAQKPCVLLHGVRSLCPHPDPSPGPERQ